MTDKIYEGIILKNILNPMHPVQKKLLYLLRDQGSIPLKYREIGRRIGESYPQTVKHHVQLLINSGEIIEINNFLKLARINNAEGSLIELPFYGLASCGEARMFTEDCAEGYIRISKNILPQKPISDLYIVQANGNSMNKAHLGTKQQCIEDEDFVVIDKTLRTPNNGDYIVSVIDGCANIKKYKYDDSLNQVFLISESTDNYRPVVLHQSDNFTVVGLVVDVIKNVNSI